MGAADLVPGISGGTIAFILGFYENFIHAIKSLHWQFLLILISGMAVSMVTLAKLLHDILGDEVYRVYLYASFFGLIIASAFFCARQVPRWRLHHFLALCIGGVIAFFLTKPVAPIHPDGPLYSVEIAVPKSTQILPSIQNYDSQTKMLKNLTPETLQVMAGKGVINEQTIVYSQSTQKQVSLATIIKHQSTSLFNGWVFICGTIAVCAMLLPGISGSYILVVLGMYTVVIGALADTIIGVQQRAFDVDAFIILANLGLGLITGAVVFSRIISWFLDHYHSTTIAVLTGFMLGALRAVWPFQKYLYLINPLKIQDGPRILPVGPYVPHYTESLLWYATIFSVVGFITVFALELIALRNRNTTS